MEEQTAGVHRMYYSVWKMIEGGFDNIYLSTGSDGKNHSGAKFLGRIAVQFDPVTKLLECKAFPNKEMYTDD